MTTLTTFLLARIADRESLARDMQQQAATGRPLLTLNGGGTLLRELIDPARVLAECAAYRAIVELHELSPYYGLDRYGRWLPREGEPKFWYCDCESDDGMIGRDGPCTTLTALASIWGDHAEYDTDWRLS